MHVFEAIARGNAADTANSYQLMCHSHLEKDVERKKQSSIVFNKTPQLPAALPECSKLCKQFNPSDQLWKSLQVTARNIK